jgi:hypothetical protein
MELSQPFRLRPISHIDFNNITTSTMLSLLLLLISPIYLQERIQMNNTKFHQTTQTDIFIIQIKSILPHSI